MGTPADEDPSAVTLAAYERYAAQYIERTPTTRSSLVDDLIALAPVGSTVLELGSGPGRDAAALEDAGLRVHRSDGATSFVDRFRSAGIEARVLDVRSDDFGGPYDALFANAVLLHVPRPTLAAVLERGLRAVRIGGVLATSFKKGDGDAWSDKKLDAPRHFTYWHEADLLRVVLASGWTPIQIAETTQPTSAERWITVTARKEGSREPAPHQL